ncbi:lactonase family protein [Colwellia sp. RE-S-Sl-9]
MNFISKKIIQSALVSSLIMLTSCKTTENNASPMVETKEHFLIGTYTKESSKGVYKVTLDPTTQSFTNEGVIATAENPSYLALSKNQSTLFAATGSTSGSVDRLTWNNELGQYNLAQQMKDLGQGTCHISLNPQETQIAIANYGSGDVHLFNVDTQTQELSKAGYFKNSGKGPSLRQEKPHMHFVTWDIAGKFLYSVDLGTDEIKVFNSNDKTFTPSVAAKLPAGDGPRHMIFHPTKPWVYAVNELTNTIAVFTQNEVTGKLTQTQHVEIAEGRGDKNISSAIKISNDGQYLYAAVRGINEIAVLKINDDGKVKFIQSHTTLGNWPRDITLSANQDHLLIANQNSNTVTVLKRDVKTGLLTSTDMKLDISIPSYIGVFK